jgi:hypothetical protein
MQRGRYIFITALALVSASAYAANPPAPTPVISLDFSKTADQGKMTINGNAAFANGKLVVVDDMGSEASSAFVTTPMQLSDYMASFDMEVKTGDPTANPADAALFLVQSGGPDHIGGGGGGAGFTRTDGQTTPRANDTTQLDYWGYDYAVDFNAWQDNGLPSQNQIIGLDINGQRTVMGRTAYNFVNKGLVHYDIRVTPDTLTVFATGGTDKLANKVLLTQPKWFGAGFFNAPNPVYFGFTGGTGGAMMEVDVSNLTISTGAGLPAPALPYPPPAATPAAPAASP